MLTGVTVFGLLLFAAAIWATRWACRQDYVADDGLAIFDGLEEL